MPLAALLDTVVTAQDADAPQDDVALLAVRLAGASTPMHHVRIPAAPELIASVRSQLRSWLAEAGVGPAAASDILLAVGEGLANAAEHAYRDELRGDLELIVRAGPDVEVELRDFGTWKEAGGDPDRGRGFTLMRALMHAVDVDRTPEGTTVRMSRRAGDAPPGAPGPAIASVREPLAPELRLIARDDEVLAVVEGDLDFVSAPELGERLAAAAGGRPLRLDLAAAGYLDSAGARMLVELARRVDLVVVAPPGSVARRALEIAELDTSVGLRP